MERIQRERQNEATTVMQVFTPATPSTRLQIASQPHLIMTHVYHIWCLYTPPPLDNLPDDAEVSGIAVTLPGPLDAATQQTLESAANAIRTASILGCSDPFVDNPEVLQLDEGKNLLELHAEPHL